jgi:arsenate reductase
VPVERKKVKVLFLCTGNSCRSQMAEAWARRLHPDSIEAHSAGTVPGKLDERAVKVMAECGVDLAGHRAKGIDDVFSIDFDFVVTVCDDAKESCPVFPGRARVLHASFEDPPRLALAARTEEEALAHFRRVRDGIRAFMEKLPDRLRKEI